MLCFPIHNSICIYTEDTGTTSQHRCHYCRARWTYFRALFAFGVRCAALGKHSIQPEANDQSSNGRATNFFQPGAGAPSFLIHALATTFWYFRLLDSLALPTKVAPHLCNSTSQNHLIANYSIVCFFVILCEHRVFYVGIEMPRNSVYISISSKCSQGVLGRGRQRT